jgi:hypothetical protein
MKNPFVREETKTITTKRVDTAINEYLQNDAIMSVVARPEKTIDIVIGADFSGRVCSRFSKRSLTQLIETLAEIRDAMED